MLGNKRLVWPNQDWHHWQQLQAACTACLRVSVSLRVYVCVCVCLCLSRWGDLIAQLSSEGKTRPRVVRIAPIKKPHKRRTTMHPGWRPLPSQSPSVFLCVCHISPPPLSHAHTCTATPDHAKADLEMRNDPPLAVHCCISSQLQRGGSHQILFKEPLSLLLER